MITIESENLVTRPHGCGTLVTALILVGGLQLPAVAQRDWSDDFEVAGQFRLETDTTGFQFPTSIAFVPTPGSRPDSPLYFVTELRGTVKVVTNDRRVHVFAKDFFTLSPIRKLLDVPYVRELGMAGLALDAARGYVFVSFTYESEDGVIKNNIVRFQCLPGTFSLRPSGKTAFTDVFVDQVGDESHMIGPMLVRDDLLYVCVGDAHHPRLSRSLDSTAGKILRMTLDGDPAVGNPHYKNAARTLPTNYVWARGLRNPFGLCFARGEMFVNDVGPTMDRFVRIERGGDYGYDGSNWSIGSHADVAFSPSNSPTGLVFHSTDSGPLPEGLRGRFYLVTTGLQVQPGPSQHGDKSILAIDYDFETHRVIGRPVIVAQYRKSEGLMPVSIAIGTDGLYVPCFSPDANVRTPILRLTHDDTDRPRRRISRIAELTASYACYGCHLESGDSVGPSLVPQALVPRLLDRLESAGYRATSLALDELMTEPMASHRAARKEVRDADGVEKVRLWIKHRLLDPRFDDPKAVMPKMGLSQSDAEEIARFLADVPEVSITESARAAIRRLIPHLKQRHLAYSLGVGLIVGLLMLPLVRVFRRFFRRERPAT